MGAFFLGNSGAIGALAVIVQNPFASFLWSACAAMPALLAAYCFNEVRHDLIEVRQRIKVLPRRRTDRPRRGA